MQRVSSGTRGKRGSVGVERRWTDKRFRRDGIRGEKREGGAVRRRRARQRLINFSLGVIALETDRAIPESCFRKVAFQVAFDRYATNFVQPTYP